MRVPLVSFVMMLGGGLQLGSDGSGDLGVVRLDGLGKVRGAGVEPCLIRVPVHGVLDPVGAVVVVAAPHHGHVLVADVPQLALSHHVDLVLRAVHVVEVGQRSRVQAGQLQDLVSLCGPVLILRSTI